MAHDDAQDIRDRSFRFACDVVKIATSISPRPGIRCIVDQLTRAACAPGANLEEAKAASSKREFVRYAEIALREARETVYWLRICCELNLSSTEKLDELKREGEQLARILGAIVVNAKRRMQMGYAAFAFCILNFALLLS